MIAGERCVFFQFVLFTEFMLVSAFPSKPLVLNSPRCRKKAGVNVQMLTVNVGKLHVLCSRRRQQKASQHPVYLRCEGVTRYLDNLHKLETVQQLVRWSSAWEESAQHLPKFGVNRNRILTQTLLDDVHFLEYKFSCTFDMSSW
jgi:hypothetical protein